MSNGKGDNPRWYNKEHIHPWLKGQSDMGSIGCKKGFHFYGKDGTCVYCKKIKVQED